MSKPSIYTVNDLINAHSQINALYLITAPLEVQSLYLMLPSNKRRKANRHPAQELLQTSKVPAMPTWLAPMTTSIIKLLMTSEQIGLVPYSQTLFSN